MTDNPFLQRYKSTDNSALLDIVENPSEYQPLAVEAARLELESRQLTKDQLVDAKSKQDLKRQVKETRQQKVKEIEDKVRSVGTSLADNFYPIQTETPSTDKIIKLISLFIGGLFLYHLYKELGMLKFMFSDEGGEWDLSMVLYFLPLIILPTSGLLFWFRKKSGWTLATLYFSYTAAGAIPMFIMALNRKPAGIQALDMLFPATSPIVYIWILLVFGLLTLNLCKQNIRVVYRVDKKSMFITLGIGTGIILLIAILF